MNISNIHDCYGCGVCAMACAKKIIDIRLNANGFYEPCLTDASKCTDCGICMDVCSFNHREEACIAQPKASYGAWSKEEGVRRVSASGGAGFEIGRFLISQGYKVVAVKYDVKHQRAEHYIATSVEEFVASMGSKYIQSYTLDAFKSINRREKYLITGTPCQIASFRRYIRRFKCEDNFILMDFFCHGVPSAFVWQRYIGERQRQLGQIEYVSWRNKQNGWHDSWAMALDGKKAKGECIDWYDSYNLLIREKKSYINSRWTKGDTFYNMFLGNNCLGKACYQHCRFKYDKSFADIRIGDMWGDTYKDNEKGVTACVAFTDRGREILSQCNCEFVEHPFKQVAEGQISEPIRYPGLGWYIVISLSKIGMVPMKWLVFTSKCVGKINRILNR